MEGIVPFATAYRPALRPIRPPIQWTAGVMRPEREAEHSPPSSAEFENALKVSSWCGS